MAVNFFFYDTIKILILLFFISVLMGIVNAYFPIERLRTYLATHKMYGLQYLLASVFGAITPFCSCSSIPLFYRFCERRYPVGSDLCLFDYVAAGQRSGCCLFLGSFGLKVTVVYVVSGILLGVIGGFVLGRMRLAPYLSDWVKQIQAPVVCTDRSMGERSHSFYQTASRHHPRRLADSQRCACLYSDRYRYRCLHARLCARRLLEQYMSKENWFAVPLSVLLAVPMYANAAGIVPVIEVFVAKGIPLGTAIAFMMAVVGLSLPEATLLKKVMTWRLIGIFFGTVAFFIILSGYLFNFIL